MVNLRSYFTKPWYVCPVDVFQWRIGQRTIHVHCLMRYVLPIRERIIVQCIRLLAYRSGEHVVWRGIRPPNWRTEGKSA
jgi:hypothetical protein